jgi:hypothetical protein
MNGIDSSLLLLMLSSLDIRVIYLFSSLSFALEVPVQHHQTELTNVPPLCSDQVFIQKKEQPRVVGRTVTCPPECFTNRNLQSLRSIGPWLSKECPSAKQLALFFLLDHYHLVFV